MREEWVNLCLKLAREPADFYASSRKIIRGVTFEFLNVDKRLKMSDAGYTQSKLTMLRKHYIHEESITVAIDLWNRQLRMKKYGSVSFTCFGHFVKGGAVDSKRSRVSSVFGPCIQSVTLTYMPDRVCTVDVFYRTTEVFKKFPADLVLIMDEMLDKFDFSTCPLDSINFHFANMTVHPMYFVTILPHLNSPIDELERIKRHDRSFYDKVMKWTVKYLVPGNTTGILKFSQAMRVHQDANARIPATKKAELIRYLKKELSL